VANDAKKVSELAVTTTLSANDRVVILSNPSSAANTKTITVANFANNLTANNATYLGGVLSTSYVNTAGAYTISGVHTHSANVIINASLSVNTSIRFNDNTTQNTAFTTSTTSFSPNFVTNTGNVLVGMTQTGNYIKTGKLCYFRIYVNYANVSSFADGGGQYQITLPFPSVATISIRGGSLHNVNTVSIYHIGGIVDVSSNASILGLYYTGSTTDLAWKNTTPVGWFTGNTSHFDISGIYETT
jgi:hypothetical protein